MTEIEINQELNFNVFEDYETYLVTDDIEYITTHDDVSKALIYSNNNAIIRFKDELSVYYKTDTIFTETAEARNFYLVETICLFTLQRLFIKFNQLQPNLALQETYSEINTRYKSVIRGNNIYKLTKLDDNKASNYIYSNGSNYTRFR